jgi:predicted acetyltransferase
MSLELRNLREEDENAFLSAFAQTENSDPNFAHYYEKGLPFSSYVNILKDRQIGVDLPDGHVPSTCLYGFVGGEVVGRVSIRHELNDFLLKIGGHIGYVVVPKHRGKGYATQMLRRSLKIASGRGLSGVLLTCDDDNAGSRRTIEKCGGILENVVSDPQHGRKRRYWISFRGPE